jgi:hypothetical protein
MAEVRVVRELQVTLMVAAFAIETRKTVIARLVGKINDVLDVDVFMRCPPVVGFC